MSARSTAGDQFVRQFLLLCSFSVRVTCKCVCETNRSICLRSTTTTNQNTLSHRSELSSKQFKIIRFTQLIFCFSVVDNIYECTQWPPPNTSIQAKDGKSKTNQNGLHQHNLNLKEKPGMNVRRWQRNRFYFNFTEIGSLRILCRVCCIFVMSTDEIEHFFIGHSIDIGLWRWRLMSDGDGNKQKRNTRNEFAFAQFAVCCVHLEKPWNKILKSFAIRTMQGTATTTTCNYYYIVLDQSENVCVGVCDEQSSACGRARSMMHDNSYSQFIYWATTEKMSSLFSHSFIFCSSNNLWQTHDECVELRRRKCSKAQNWYIRQNGSHQ